METSTENIGTIVSATGHVYLETESGLILLENGDTISKGAVIITQDDGKVEIRFEDNTTLSQAENSRISIDDYVYDQDDGSNSHFLLHMAKGTLRTVTGKIAEQNPDEFKVKSPLATIGIRGTEFWVISNEDGDRVYLGDIAPGHIMVIQDEFGTIRFMNSSGTFAALVRDTPMGPLRVASQEEMQEIQERTPITSVPPDDNTPNNDTGDPQGAQEGPSPHDGDPDQNPDTPLPPPTDGDQPQGPPPSEGDQQLGPLPWDQPQNPGQLPEYLQNPLENPLPLFGDILHIPLRGTPPPAPLGSTPPDQDPFGTDAPQDPLLDTTLEDELNGAPVASNLEITAENETTVVGQLHATDPDGDDLTFSIAQQPDHGTVTIGENGSFSYIPEQTSLTSDSFAYTVTDDQGASDEATVVITFDPNQPPDAVTTSILTEEDSNYTGQLQATDPEEGTLTFLLAQDGEHGTATINADGTFLYTPVTGYSGNDVFTFVVTDDHGAADTATVTVTIDPANATPEAPDQSISMWENTSYSNTLSASDPDNDPLAFSLTSTPAHGDLTLNTSGEYEYIPEANYHGSDTFTFQVTDPDGLSDTAAVNITVNENAAPFVPQLTYSTDENTHLSGTLVTDADGDTLTFSNVTDPIHGALTLSGTGEFNYTPTTNYTGADQFTFTVTDGKSDPQTETINVSVVPTYTPPSNNPPTTPQHTFTTNKDTTLSGTLVTDADNDPLTFTNVSGPTHGELTLNETGTFTYTPQNDYAGSDQFTFTVTDGKSSTQTESIAVSINNIPVITSNGGCDSATIAVDENTTAVTTVTASDVDTSDTLTYSIVGGEDQSLFSMASGGVLAFNTAPDFETPSDSGSNNTYEVSVQVADGHGGSDTQNIAVTVNDVNEIRGTSGPDELEGTSGVDYIYGEEGIDYISGGEGADYIYGGEGADSLIGGEGADHLFGGEGNDLFIYTQKNSFGDIIHDFNHVDDTLQFNAYPCFSPDDAVASLTGSLAAKYFHEITNESDARAYITSGTHDYTPESGDSQNDDYFVYVHDPDSNTCKLYYDSDGTNGDNASQPLALIAEFETTAELDHTDILMA